MKLLLAILLLIASISCTKSNPVVVPNAVSVPAFVSNVFNPAVALLYVGKSNGIKNFDCTATAFHQTVDHYLFLTAAHCVIDGGDFYLSPDFEDPEIYYHARVVAFGDLRQNLDFAVLEVIAPAGMFTTVPLGHNPTVVGEDIFSLSSPNGIGKSYITGTIAILDITHNVEFYDKNFHINWKHNMLGNMLGQAPGSSGSAIVCKSQMAVCGVIVGRDPAGSIYEPIERFEKWWIDVQSGKVKAFAEVPQNQPTGNWIRSILHP